MRAVASTVYRLVRFPHQGKIVSIDQLDYCSPNVRFDATANVPLVNSHAAPELIGAGLFKDPCLMGVFPPPVPDAFVAPINMISSVGTFMGDPWILPSPTEVEQYGDTMPLSPAEKTYSTIQSESISPNRPPMKDVLDIYSLPEWAAIPSSSSHDFLNDVLLSDEAIIEAMTISERPWEDNHHRSSVLPPLHEEDSPLPSTATEDGPTRSPNTSSRLPTEGNLSNIAKTIITDISVKTGTVEAIIIGANSTQQEILNYKALFTEFRDIFAWSYEEMPGIDPRIVVHEIKTYAGAKPVRQKLRPIHPKKAAAIKAEVEKLLKAGFIYPVPLTEWVSNIVPVTKKQGTIRVCVDYRDLNKACPKDNYPTPFIDQIIDDCAGCEIFSFMDGFSGYNQIDILLQDQHKTTFICPWRTFAYRKLPFGLKNAGATFQRAMSYAFHDIKSIVQPYLDDLPAKYLCAIDIIISG